jgi:dihydroorotate dehydrogenase (NAD+) catalytic subunit
MRRGVDLRTHVRSVALPNPVLTASGTAGHGAELASYVDLSTLGAVVVKSLAALPWAGNPAPRLHDTPAGLLNSVGLQGPGISAWLAHDLPALVERGARVVASIWGNRVEDYARAAEMLTGAPGVVAVEVNVSCPNVENRSRMFAHSARATADAVAAAACGVPRWVKLSPNVADLVDIAGAALEAGAEALVLVNTVLGMAIDPKRRTYRLGSGPGGGGLSGPAIRPLAVRAVHDCRAAFPDAGIVGVGGVTRGVDAVEMLMAGADAVEVGTATFRDPRAPVKVLSGLARWCRLHGVEEVRALVAAVHASARDGGDVSTPAAKVADLEAQARDVMAEAQWQVGRLKAAADRQVREQGPAPHAPRPPSPAAASARPASSTRPPSDPPFHVPPSGSPVLPPRSPAPRLPSPPVAPDHATPPTRAPSPGAPAVTSPRPPPSEEWDRRSRKPQ